MREIKKIMAKIKLKEGCEGPMKTGSHRCVAVLTRMVMKSIQFAYSKVLV